MTTLLSKVTVHTFGTNINDNKISKAMI